MNVIYEGSVQVQPSTGDASVKQNGQRRDQIDRRVLSENKNSRTRRESWLAQAGRFFGHNRGRRTGRGLPDFVVGSDDKGSGTSAYFFFASASLVKDEQSAPSHFDSRLLFVLFSFVPSFVTIVMLPVICSGFSA